MAGLPARARKRRARGPAAISSPNGSASEMAASRFSAGVMITAFVRGVTISTSSGRPNGSGPGLLCGRMAASHHDARDGLRRAGGSSRELATDGADEDEVLVPHGLELRMATPPPAAARERLAEVDDVAWSPAQQLTESQNRHPQPGALASADTATSPSGSLGMNVAIDRGR